MDAVYKIGLDIGSTTIKTVVLEPDGSIAFSGYRRHHARIRESLSELLQEIHKQIGDALVCIRLTGSVGMGVAEKYGLPFTQEVVAATHYIKQYSSQCGTMIDIGGEDAKVVFFNNGTATDLRMNGNCAGGTGAFIDQMALLLGVSVEQMNGLALKAERIYPIASRCGVFSKTDVQNLIARNTARTDIAASIFHAVAVQVVVTLAHGCEIKPPVLFCGGPLTFLPALRKAFTDYLHLREQDIILPENSHLIPAWGTALTIENGCGTRLSDLMQAIHSAPISGIELTHRLEPIFTSKEDYGQWKARMTQHDFRTRALHGGTERITLGIDSGSTTTKIVALNQQDELLYTYYANNNGNPIATVEKGLEELEEACRKSGTDIRVTGSCATGYGEDLIKAALPSRMTAS